MSIKDGRSFPRDVLEHYRFRALTLHKEGQSVNGIAHFFGVHRGSVSRWITVLKRDGRKALKKRTAPGPSYKLSSEEMESLILLLRDDATTHGFETPLWTCLRIQQLIQKRTGKKIHVSNVMRWLKKLNFTNQKPKRQASQQNKNAVKRWVKEEWPKIREHAHRWQAMIYFLDEAGVSLIPVMGKTWAPKGKTPIVKVTGKKGGLCVTSAISPIGKMVFRIEKEKITALVHIEFLEQILKHHPPRKIIIIEDNARPHTAKKVKEFTQQHKKRLAIYYLPSYAPELNPDEHVWEYLKARNLKAHQAQIIKELKHLVKRKMQSIQRQPSLIRSFFKKTYVT